MNDLHYPLQWAERAEEDYQLCLAALKRSIPLTYGATFHAQQCAEKYLKALLTLREIAFPRTHDLSALSSLCYRNGVILPIEDDDLDKLSAYAVEVRYPGIQPTVDEARDALRIAKTIRKIIRRHLAL
jgi:HEPN domain-containing protein